MKFYLAARYSRKQELCEYRDLLSCIGHGVTSRWLDGDYPTNPGGRSLVAPDHVRRQVAAEDIADVLAADVFLAFTEPGRNDGRGGRHVEFGVALASNKKTVVIGEAENVFYILAPERYPSWTDFLNAWFPVEPRGRPTPDHKDPP